MDRWMTIISEKLFCFLVQSPMSPSQSHTPLGLLKLNGYGGSIAPMSVSRGGVYANSATPLPQTDLGSVQTELFLQVILCMIIYL